MHLCKEIVKYVISVQGSSLGLGLQWHGSPSSSPFKNSFQADVKDKKEKMIAHFKLKKWKMAAE